MGRIMGQRIRFLRDWAEIVFIGLYQGAAHWFEKVLDGVPST